MEAADGKKISEQEILQNMKTNDVHISVADIRSGMMRKGFKYLPDQFKGQGINPFTNKPYKKGGFDGVAFVVMVEEEA